MSLTLITGPANAGKAHLVLERARAAARAGLEPLLVVPTAADVEVYRRELAEGGTVLGVRVLRFDGFVEEVARRLGVARRPLAPLARRRVAASAISTARLRSLRGQTEGLVDALVELAAELRALRVSPARLRSALELWGEGDSRRLDYARDLALLYERYCGLLADLDRTDREGHVVSLLDALRAEPQRWGHTPVLLYGFDDLTLIEHDAVETLSRLVDAPVTVALAYEAGRVAFAGRARAFETLRPLADEHIALPARAEHYAAGARSALHHIERSLFEAAAPGSQSPPPSAPTVRLLEGGSQRAELELIAAAVAELLDDGLQPDEIALVTRSPQSYAPLLEQVLRARSIPYALVRRVRLDRTAVGRGLVGLLRSALLDGSAADLLAWLSCPGVIRNRELVDTLEAHARRLGWRRAAELRAHWEHEHWQLDELDSLLAARDDPRALIRGARRALDRLIAAPARGAASVLGAAALDEARAGAQVAQALEELEDLAALRPQLAGDPAALVAELEHLEIVLGGSPAASAVAIVDPLGLRARRARAVLLCGLQEGVFPARGSAEPFLSDSERRLLAQRSGLRLELREDRLHAERYLFYAAVSRPRERLVLSWHTADEDGEAVSPSLFIDDLLDLFGPDLYGARSRRPLGAVTWRSDGPPPGPRDVRLSAALIAGGRPERSPGPVDGGLLERLRGRAELSASALELWAACPVRWFIERQLDADDLEPEPEPLVRGLLAHAALEEALRGLSEHTGEARLGASGLQTASALMRASLARLASERPLATDWARNRAALRRLTLDLERYLVQLSSSGGEFVPRHFEVSFGMDEAGLPPLTIAPGVRLRGRMDRIDTDSSGHRAIVYDYKGMGVTRAARWIAERRFQLALYMRAARDLLGLNVVGGLYQPIGARDARPRGVVLEAEAGGLELVRNDRLEREQFDVLLQEAVELACEAAAELRSGRLEPRPVTCAPGGKGGCQYPVVCRCAGAARSAPGAVAE